MGKKYLFLILFYNELILSIHSTLLYPASFNVAKLKPINVHPIGSTCGLDGPENFCDNRFNNVSSCIQIQCEQICPFGKVFSAFQTQMRLELMQPCEITKDFSFILAKSSQQQSYSYFFDVNNNNNKCVNDGNSNSKLAWKPFMFASEVGEKFYHQMNTNDKNGFSFTLWFQQFISNTGTLIHLFRNDININNINNLTLFKLTVKSSIQKIYINYYCNKSKACSIEIDTKLAFNSRNSTPNFIALTVFKNELSIFINEPLNVNDLPSIDPFNLEFDLGSYFMSSYKLFSLYVSRSSEEMSGEHFFGWIQDVKFFLFALTNTEICEIFNKKKVTIYIQPECRCPNGFPRSENEFSIYCTTNKKSLQRQLRLNKSAHNVMFLNDEDMKSEWISSTSPNDVTISMDLNDTYLIHKIEIMFSSLPSTNLIMKRFSQDKWHIIQDYSVKSNSKKSQNQTLISWQIDSKQTNISIETEIDNLKASKLQFKLSDFYSEIKSDLRKLYYAIAEIRVMAYCDCNGFSDSCDLSKSPYECKCQNSSFTTGPKCNKCLPLYNERKYENRYKNPLFSCISCDCNNRSDSCVFNSSLNRGMCENCRNQTYGMSCEQCPSNSYFNRILNSCTKCKCDLNGTTNANCNPNTGDCECKINVQGIVCSECKEGHFNLSQHSNLGCAPCDCNLKGTLTSFYNSSLPICNKITGKCFCKSFVQGERCDECKDSMFDLNNSACNQFCNCDPYGSVGPICNKITGQCVCKPNVYNLKCKECAKGFYNMTSYGCVSKCGCYVIGSLNPSYCNKQTGQCECKLGYQGLNCEICAAGYFKINTTHCVPCQCNLNGVLNNTDSQSNAALTKVCDKNTGQCICNQLSEGRNCDRCKQGYWGDLSIENFGYCKKCICDSRGTSNTTLIPDSDGAYRCDTLTGKCTCNKNRVGVRCESCTVGYFMVNITEIDCLECNCDSVGTIPGSTCDKFTGECVCKQSNGIGGTRCDICLPGFYEFSRMTGSCAQCHCNPAGSMREDCVQNSFGTCYCKPFVTGNKCDFCTDGTSNLDQTNPFGCSKTPSKQSPPRIEIQTPINGTVLALVSWDLPDYPNGIILYHLLYKNDMIVFNSTERSFEDFEINPNQIYKYHVQSFNSEGNTTSKQTLFEFEQ